MTAFLTTRASDGKYIGAFVHGSMYRAGHDVFEWSQNGGEQARLRFLQDDTSVALRIESCAPAKGFDYCMLLHGDPTGAVKYQSRKRWAVRRPGKQAELVPGVLGGAVVELAEDDQDLRVLFGS